MAAQLNAFVSLFVLFLAVQSAFSADLKDSSPSPAPEVGADNSNSPISSPPASSPASSPDISSPPANSPAPSPDISSPPAPPPEPEAPDSPSSSPTPETSPSPSPSPFQSPPSDFDSPSPAPEAHYRAADSISTTTAQKESSRGMSGGKKVGIVFAVLVGAGVVMFAGIIYKKRQQNIRRSRYGYATREGLI